MTIPAANQLKINKLTSIASIILFNLALYTSFVSFALRPRHGDRMSDILLWPMLAFVAGSLLVPALIKLCRSGRKLALSARGALKMLPLIFLLTVSLPTFWFGFDIWLQNSSLRHYSNFTWYLLMPGALHIFFRGVEPTKRGLWFGLGFGLGILYWWALMFYVGTHRMEIAGPAHPALYLVFTLQTALVHLLAAVLLHLFVFARTPPPFSAADPAPIIETTTPKRDARLLLLAATLSYIMSGAIDIHLFPFVSIASAPTVRFWHVLPLLTLLPVGWLLDRAPVATYRRLTLLCSAVFVLTPCLLTLDETPALFRVLHVATMLVQFLVYILFAVVIADLEPLDEHTGMRASLLFGLRFIAVLLFEPFKQDAVPEGVIVLGATAMAIIFYILVRQVRFLPRSSQLFTSAMPPVFASAPGGGTGTEADAKAQTDETATVSPIDAYLDSHHLTAREREVAALVLRGQSTREIAAHLDISEHTVKTHVKNILNKSGFPHRKAFVSTYLLATNTVDPKSGDA